MVQISDEDAELDEQWRQVFGQPLPLLGAPGIARQIIHEQLSRIASDRIASDRIAAAPNKPGLITDR